MKESLVVAMTLLTHRLESTELPTMGSETLVAKPPRLQEVEEVVIPPLKDVLVGHLEVLYCRRTLIHPSWGILVHHSVWNAGIHTGV